MKRLVAVVLVSVMLFSVAGAEIDFSSMSFDELVNLSHELTAEIMNRPEWKEVEVPEGQWRVGIDIPAGAYSIKVKELDRVSPVKVTVWEKDSLGSAFSSGALYQEYINAESSINRLELKEGWLLEVNRPVIFMPPVILGF